MPCYSDGRDSSESRTGQRDVRSFPPSYWRGSKSAIIRAILARSASEANSNPRLRFGLV